MGDLCICNDIYRNIVIEMGVIVVRVYSILRNKRMMKRKMRLYELVYVLEVVIVLLVVDDVVLNRLVLV